MLPIHHPFNFAGPSDPIALQSDDREEELACLTRDNSSHILPTLLLTPTT